MSSGLSLVQKIKISCFSAGVAISPAAERELSRGGTVPLSLHEYATTGGVTFELPGAVYVNAPFDEAYCIAPEVTLDLDHSRAYGVRYQDEWLPVRMLRLPGYLDALDGEGNRVIETVMSHADRARVSPIVGCAFDCGFCDLPAQRYRRRDISQIEAALAVALADDVLPVRHAMVSGGSPGPRDHEYFDQTCVELAERCPVPLDVMMSARDSATGYLDRMVAAGVTGFALNMELASTSQAEQLMPRKAKFSQPTLLRSVERAVELLGAEGAVRSLLIVGLEPLEHTLAGVEAIARLGADPVLSPFRPANGTTLSGWPAPDAELLERAWVEASEISAKFGVQMGPRCAACQHNTLTFPLAMPA